MKRTLALRWCWIAGFAALTLWLRPLPVTAQEGDPGGPGDRLARLERRLNELAERQDQILRQLGQRPEFQGPPGPRGGPLPPELRGPGPGPGPMPPPPALHALHALGGLARLATLIWLLANILLAIWIYTDIRKRGDGPGVLIALALVAGVPAAIIYALVRIGDRKPQAP